MVVPLLGVQLLRRARIWRREIRYRCYAELWKYAGSWPDPGWSERFIRNVRCAPLGHSLGRSDISHGTAPRSDEIFVDSASRSPCFVWEAHGQSRERDQGGTDNQPGRFDPIRVARQRAALFAAAIYSRTGGWQ